MSSLSSHVLDTASGKPAEGIPVLAEHDTATDSWAEVARGTTDADGRVKLAASLAPGTYRVTFTTSTYLTAQGNPVFYPYVQVVFRIDSPDQHFHIPLLLSPFGYSTYRGS